MGRRRTSPRLRANRSNARKSTGPRTSSGKQISSMNATIHGLSAKTLIMPSDPEIDLFAGQLCVFDKSETALYLAHEIAQAQSRLNTVRSYKLILHQLHAADKDSPMPACELLDDPHIEEFFQYMQTDELDFWFGPKTKKDWRFFFSLKKAIYRLSKTPRRPQLQIAKLNRYEQAAIQNRQIAIGNWDAYQAAKESKAAR